MQRLKTLLRNYYKRDLIKLYKFLVPRHKKILKISSNNLKSRKRYDYIILDNCIGNIKDVQIFFEQVKKNLKSDSRLIITYYNYVWEPILKIASLLGLRNKVIEQNWLDNEDISNLLNLAGFDVITRRKRFFGLTIYVVARLKINYVANQSVSIIIPARNEAGNISKIVKSIPRFGKKQEIIFVEGGSIDDTWMKIQKEINKNNKVRAFKQPGSGKADAVRYGFSKSTGDIFIIYDADMTVYSKDLIKFYNALVEGKGEFANGTRLVYPMEKDAMQTLNKFFNKFFSLIFTWIFGQRFKDTLCGTKAFFRKDYLKFKKFKDDPFGDFELIFGAINNNLKVVEIPVRYKERVYGSTNINRFKHGILLIKMIIIAFIRFRIW